MTGKPIRTVVLMQALFCFSHPFALGGTGVVTFEADGVYPEALGFERTTFCEPERWFDAGWFFQHVDAPGPCGNGPGGDSDGYTFPIDFLIGSPTFFLEWRSMSDGDSSKFGGGTPSSMVAGGLGTADYSFLIASDQIKFTQDAFVVVLFIDIAPDVPHTYRLELYDVDSYTIYIDGAEVHTGVPGAAFPGLAPVIQWRTKSWTLENTTQWDYIRFGVIPIDGSGDYDSDGVVDEGDLYFFAECAGHSGEGIDAGPGCRFADFDFDTDVDCDDWLVFESLCGCSFGSDGDVDENGAVDFDDILCVLNGFAGNFDVCPFDAVDIVPCNGNAVIDFDDILAALEAFAGNPPCPNPCAP